MKGDAEVDARKVEQLKSLFSNMFSKESLRRNVYIFNALSPSMELPLKKIIEERRVAAITHHQSTIKQVFPIVNIGKALELCPYVKWVMHKTYKILMSGDKTIVKLSFKGKPQTKTQENHDFGESGGNQREKTILNQLTKQMKCKIQELEGSKWRIEFGSQAAVFQFTERVKSSSNQSQFKIEVELMERDPYLCLADAIAAVKRDKSSKTSVVTASQDFSHDSTHISQHTQAYTQYYQQLGYYYPVFIRKAVQSQSEDEDNCKDKGNGKNQTSLKDKNPTTNQRKNQVSLSLNSQDFPQMT